MEKPPMVIVQNVFLTLFTISHRTAPISVHVLYGIIMWCVQGVHFYSNNYFYYLMTTDVHWTGIYEFLTRFWWVLALYTDMCIRSRSIPAKKISYLRTTIILNVPIYKRSSGDQYNIHILYIKCKEKIVILWL